MNYYGDVSGDFRGLLHDYCPVVVVAVVRGDQISAKRCAKRTVRRVKHISEAKWNDLLDVQKRRFFECFAEQDNIAFGYAKFTKSQLHSMDAYHHLYQDTLNPKWDLALTGYAYGEILFEMGALEDRRDPIFDFDRVDSEPQCRAVKSHVANFVENADVYFDESRQNHGIQAADCLAGGIAEDHKRGTDWLDMLDMESITNSNHASIIQLENDLTSL